MVSLNICKYFVGWTNNIWHCLSRIIAISFISVVISSTTFAPRIDVYTRLACEALRAEHVEGEPRPRLVDWSWRRFPPPPKSCTQDDQVQEAVAALSTSDYNLPYVPLRLIH